MDTKQMQKAGDNANQVQANTVYILNGISEERVREICSEIALQAIKENSHEANDIALKRIDNLTNLMLPRLQSIEQTFESFSDPSFQILIRKAQITAASSDREGDYKILTELLVHRINNKKNIKKKASISKAIEIIDQIDNDSLAALTMVHAIDCFFPVTGNISEGIQVLSDLYEKIGYSDLPTDNLWIDNLSILGCISVATFFKPNNLEDQFCNSLDGYTCVGIKKGDSKYAEACTLLATHDINGNILVDHELNDGYVRLNIVQRQQINNLIYSKTIIVDGLPKIEQTKITQNQKNCLENIFGLYSKDNVLAKKVNEEFIKLLRSHKAIESIIDWKNKIGTAFNLTSVGKVIAHANAKKIDPTLPDLD